MNCVKYTRHKIKRFAYNRNRRIKQLETRHKNTYNKHKHKKTNRKVERMEHKTTEAKRKAIYKYDDKFERINCRLAKGTKERIKKLGYKSTNDFIKLSVMERLEKEEKYLK